MTQLKQLAMTAAGSFVVGFFAAHFAQPGVSARPLVSRIIGVFLVGVVGGFATFPAFSRNSSAPNPDAEAAMMVFTVVSSLDRDDRLLLRGRVVRARMTAA
jgi:fluoride ion exporter CrcB/FEX